MNFGREQADLYEQGLRQVIDIISDNPRLAAERLEYDPPVRIHHHAKHHIIYLIEDTHILIVRVLRDKVDLARTFEYADKETTVGLLFQRSLLDQSERYGIPNEEQVALGIKLQQQLSAENPDLKAYIQFMDGRIGENLGGLGELFDFDTYGTAGNSLELGLQGAGKERFQTRSMWQRSFK